MRAYSPSLMDAKKAKGIVASFSGKKLLVVGDVCLDRYVFGQVERLNPEAPVPILHARRETVATGAAGNTAKNAAELGARAILVSVVGKDRVATEVLRQTKAEGYKTKCIVDAARPTTEKIRYLVSSQQMLRVDHEETHDIKGKVEAQVMAAVRAAAKQADAIIVSDYAKGVVTRRVAEAVMAASRKHQLPVLADVKPSRGSYFKGATFISPNRKEAHELLGLNQFVQGGAKPAHLARRLKKSFGSTVFLTLSADGMFVLGSQAAGTHVPQVHRIEVADPSGCGDTAAVTILLAKLAGATDIEAAQLANAAGAVVASRIGSVGLTQDELIEIIQGLE